MKKEMSLAVPACSRCSTCQEDVPRLEAALQTGLISVLPNWSEESGRQRCSPDRPMQLWAPPPRALPGYFSRELAPALTIDSGDVVSFQTLDSGWGAIEQEVGFSEPRDFVPRDLTRDVAHALAGPVAIN